MKQELLDPPETCPRPPLPAERSWLRFCLRLALFACVTCVSLYVYHTFLGENFHAIIPGKVYRSAQPSAASLKRLIARHGIRTVLNLRGLAAGTPWYMEQCEVVQELGMGQEDITFSAHRLPSAHEVRRLIEAVDQAEPPLLLHCRQGADRTGLAAAIIRFLHSDDTLDEGLRHMGWRYGHLPVGKTLYMDRFFDLYTHWLREEDKTHSPAVFHHWACHEYQGGWCQHAIESVEPMQAIYKPDEPSGFRVRLRNISARTWRFLPHETAGVHLGIEVLGANNQLVHLGRAGQFDKAVAPGERIELVAVLPPLRQVGPYRIRLDMIDEGHGWFQQAGAEAREVEIMVHE